MYLQTIPCDGYGQKKCKFNCRTSSKFSTSQYQLLNKHAMHLSTIPCEGLGHNNHRQQSTVEPTTNSAPYNVNYLLVVPHTCQPPPMMVRAKKQYKQQLTAEPVENSTSYNANCLLIGSCICQPSPVMVCNIQQLTVGHAVILTNACHYPLSITLPHIPQCDTGKTHPIRPSASSILTLKGGTATKECNNQHPGTILILTDHTCTTQHTFPQTVTYYYTLCSVRHVSYSF